MRTVVPACARPEASLRLESPFAARAQPVEVRSIDASASRIVVHPDRPDSSAGGAPRHVREPCQGGGVDRTRRWREADGAAGQLGVVGRE